MSNDEEPKPKTLGWIDRSVTPFWRAADYSFPDIIAEIISALTERQKEYFFGPPIEIVSAAEYARRIAKREEEILELKGEQPK